VLAFHKFKIEKKFSVISMGDCNVIALGRGIGFKATFLGVHFRVLLL
jgi:hypothetical protein